MYIELKTKRDKENEELIKGYYIEFEKIFIEKQGKTLVQHSFDEGDKKTIDNKILSYIENGQIASHHSWGINGRLIFQIDLLYFHFLYRNKEYVYRIGYQFQEPTIKINCARSFYMDSTPNEIEDFIPIFKKYKNSSFFNGRIGSPITRAYISITKRLDDIHNFNTKEKCEKLYKLLEQSYNLLNNIKQDIENTGGKMFNYSALAKKTHNI
jgi:hypothetical protein